MGGVWECPDLFELPVDGKERDEVGDRDENEHNFISLSRNDPEISDRARKSRRDLSATPLPEGRFSNIMQPMEVHFTPELEAKLTQSATQQGRNPDELVQEVVAQYFDEESRFIQAVNRGEEALRRGEYLTHEQVGQRLERFLRS